MPSLQLRTYLTARASGTPLGEAADLAGFSLAEARLTDAAVERGEIEAPHVHVREDNEPTKEETMVSGTVAGDELRWLIERIERLHEERKSIADEIKDVFAEAKDRGFDTAAMRCVMKLRKMDPDKRDEAEAIVAVYLSALGMTPIEQAIALAA
jgi:uncharacterized protein (UPF0335 family)